MHYTITIRGIRPFAFARDYSDKRLNPATSLDGKRKKSPAELEHIEHTQFLRSFYVRDDKLFVPNNNLRQMIVDGARKFRNGSQAISGTLVEGDGEFQYDGPTPEKMYEAPLFVLRRSIPNAAGSRSIAINPVVPEWKTRFRVFAEPSLAPEADLKKWITEAGKLVGIGGNRTLGYGRFVLESCEQG